MPSKIYCIFFFLFTSCVLLRGQNFISYIHKADSLGNAGLYMEADEMYDTAFQSKTTILYGFYYNAAINNVKAGNYEKAINQIGLSINGGLVDFKSLLEDSELQNLKKHKKWKTILHLIQVKENTLNRNFISDLKHLYQKDQFPRIIGDCQSQFSNEQQEIFKELVSEIDSLNVLAVIDLIKENNGWLGLDIVGYEGNLTVWLIIQHADISIQETYIPLLKKSVLQRQSSGEHLAMLQDRVLMRKGKKQIYGTQIKRNKETGKFYVYAIQNLNNVDNIRNSIGLPPINEYLIRWNLSIENDYNDKID